MSGSPKKSYATLMHEVQERLEAERRRQALLEERQRKEREAADRERRRVACRQNVERRLFAANEAIAGCRRSSFARFVESELAKLERALPRAPAANAALATLDRMETEIAAAIRTLDSIIARGRAQEAAHAARERLAREQAEAAAAIESFAGELGAVAEAIRLRFDGERGRRLEQALADARGAFAAGRVADVDRLLRPLADALERHLDAAQAAHLAHEQRRVALEAAIADLQIEVDGLRADPTVTAWCATQVTALIDTLRQCAAGVASGSWDRAEHGLDAVRRAVPATIAAAQARQLQDDQRDYILRGLRGALEAQGFEVSPTWQVRSGDRESNLVIRAVRPDRRSVIAQFPVGGLVEYEVDGFEKREEAGRDGRPVATCDEAEQRLQDLHAQMARDFGITMDEITWEGKDPLRIGKTENELPSDAGLSQYVDGDE